MRFSIARRLEQACIGCGFCERELVCPGEAGCTGCGACVSACPARARVLELVEEERELVRIRVSGEPLEVPARITVLRALELAGYEVSSLPGEGDLFAPCRTGGCWTCAVEIDGTPKPSCITPVREGMKINLERRGEPLRLVSGFQGHSVGGVGTPHWLKPRGPPYRYVEVACFAHGCILRCPTCQNWEITYSSAGQALSPAQAARAMTSVRRECGVDRMAISGGEPTLNREWLLAYLRELRRLNPDQRARLHVDTNGVLLTRDYLEALVEAGMTDVGLDLKGLELRTFMRITGLEDRELAQRLWRTEWQAVEYLLKHLSTQVFVGLGIPYNPAFISLEEIARLGERIASLDPEVQVCVLDYRPEFRAWELRRPSYEQMLEVKRVLEGVGLRCVLAQTERGHLGP